ncbi:helix-turn-helix transcriptional regulator [Saliterribacillus persicus]|uniref:Regulatory LuxR family protein n=1 Tax=Saliterribacillus persicus TaxID=930114 RepID=A0A368Y344_9BACI|nr:helix-turn-helix transcriptional regulator [Saliterribacillus persicus]RCW73247.1 regulatory LuxR family protein [Saliterribacillus persicus]
MNEANAIRKRIRQKLYTICSFDASCIRTVDPNNLLTTGALTDEVIEKIHPQLFVNEYLDQDIHSQYELASSSIPIKVLSHSTNSEKSKRLQEILFPAGFKSEMRMAFVTGGQCYGFASLYRRDLAFNSNDVNKIRKQVKEIASIIRKHVLRVTNKAKPFTIQPMLIMSSSFTILYQNQQAKSWLHQLSKQEDLLIDQIPRSIRAIFFQVLKNRKNHSNTIMIDSEGELYALEAALLTDHEDEMVIVIKKGPITNGDWFSYLIKCYQWTAKESEIIRYIIKGDTTNEIADQLSISPYTVQDHLKSIFLKTNINSRSKLTNLINGW